MDTPATQQLVQKLYQEGYHLVGSRYFFSGRPCFQPHDWDFTKVFRPGEIDINYCSHEHVDNVCINKIVARNPAELLNHMFECNIRAEAVGSFLNPEVAREIGFDFNKQHNLLVPFINRLRYTRWRYVSIVFDSFVENGDIYLTLDQLQKAYESYLETRQ